jgi:hypothetical protein
VGAGDFAPEYRESLEVSPVAVVNRYLSLASWANAPFGIDPTPAIGQVSPYVLYQSRVTSALSGDLAGLTYGRFL